MRWLVIFLSFFISTFIFAQEKSAAVIQSKAVIPEVGKHVGANMDALTTVIALLMVLALIIACAFILKGIRPKNFENKGLKIVTSLQLGSKERLVVVQIGDKQQLLGVTTQHITLLDTLDEPIKASSPITAELGKSLVSLVQKHVSNKKNTLTKESS